MTPSLPAAAAALVVLAPLASAEVAIAAPVLAPVVAPATPLDGCPSARQVTAALEARLSGSIVSPADASWRPDALRSLLEPSADGATVRFSLTTADGQVQLRRVLPVPGAGGTPDCAALAETIAAIVERYLREIPYEGPPVQLPAPGRNPAGAAADLAGMTWPRVGAFGLLAGAGLLPAPPRGLAHGEAQIGGGIELRRDRRTYIVGLTGGLAQPLQVVTAGTAAAEVTLRRFPLRLRANVARPLGRGLIEAGVQVGVDVFAISWEQAAAGSPGEKWLIGPVTELLLGYRVPLTRDGRFFVRSVALAGLATSRYRFVATGATEPVLTTWVTYLTAGLELGALFR